VTQGTRKAARLPLAVAWQAARIGSYWLVTDILIDPETGVCAMQTDNRFIDDMAKLATSALGTLQGVKDEVETQVRQRFERMLVDMDLVTREEFEAVEAMAAKARAENEALAARLAVVEKQQAAGKPRKAAPKATAAGRKAAAKASHKAPSGKK